MKNTDKTTKKSSKKIETKEKVEKELGPFDFINTILKSKKNLIDESDNPELASKTYSPFLTNRALSFHLDTVLHANEMNMNSGLDSDLQYQYLLSSVRAANRGFSWPKKSKDENHELIKEAFKINDTRAKEMLWVVGDEAVILAKKLLNKGGKIK